MSNTNLRNGQRIWDAVNKLSAGEGLPMPRQWFFVSEVAELSGMSKPTCRKYLDIAVERGAAIKHTLKGGWHMYHSTEWI